MNSDKMREAFEVFAKDRGLATDKLCHGDYRQFSTGEAWEAWQTALAQQPESEPVFEIQHGPINDGDGHPKWARIESLGGWDEFNFAPGTKLYAGPPPAQQTESAPVAGVEAAAQWVEARRDAYIEEHGSFDPDTNVMEFPGDGSDYVNELDDIAEGIRSLSPQPTQQVPDQYEIGIYGRAYDGPGKHRAYTYNHQPDNVTAWKLGEVAHMKRSGGDQIDYGLTFLYQLHGAGFGVFEIDAPSLVEKNDE